MVYSWYIAIIHQLKYLHTIRKKCKCSPTTHNLQRPTSAETLFNSNVETAKAMYENSLIESMLSKSTSTAFHYMRSITSSIGLPSELQLNKTHAYSDYDKANLYNKYFNPVFTMDSCTIPDLNTIPSLSFWAYWQHQIFWAEVFEALTCLGPNKAMGIDMISPKILKYCAAALVQPVYHLFTLTLSQQQLPLDWKTRIIIPMFKSGNKNQVNNYHPISLCIISWTSCV